MTDQPQASPRFGTFRGLAYVVPETRRALTMGDFAAAHDGCLDAAACVHGGPCPHKEDESDAK